MTNQSQAYQTALSTARSLMAEQQPLRAVEPLRKAIAMQPDAPEAYVELGEACLALKRVDRALECYKLAARYSRGDIAILNKVADLQERQGQVREAARTYLATAEVCMRRNDWDRAIGNWQRSSQLEPSLLGPHKRLAVAYQRQDNKRDAVREYLAIARILQERKEYEMALRMCQAALRLDPTNADVLKAVELVQKGEHGYDEGAAENSAEVEEPAVVEEEDSIAGALRSMADVFEIESEGWRSKLQATQGDPIEAARRQAQEELAEEVFREESGDSSGSLTKLERDALVGQALDFERRGFGEQAIACYEQAIAGGLSLPAAHFVLGLLYLKVNRISAGRQSLALSVAHPAYRQAAQLAIRQVT